MKLLLKSVGALVMVGALTGCGQKYPESYGLYIRDGQTWKPVSNAGRQCMVSGKPEFLIYDARLAQSSEKPNDTITLRSAKWIRWNINMVVARADASPRLYEKSKIGSFAPSRTSLNMSYSPVNNHRDMLIASPTAPIEDGFFVLDYFGDKVICRKNVTDAGDSLPEKYVVDKWCVVHDEKAGFAWDAFLAASQNGGRAVFNEGYASPQQLNSLLETLRTEMGNLVSTKNYCAMMAFCQKVERLDGELYASAKRQCLSVIEGEMANAKSNHDLPTVIGIGSIAAKAGICSDQIRKEVESCKHDVSEREPISAATVAELMANMTNAGTRIATFSRNMGLILASPEVLVTDTHLNYVETTWMRTVWTWFGEIRDIKKTGDVVEIWTQGTSGQSFTFRTASERDRFYETVTGAWKKWKALWVKRLTVEIRARPRFWSESIAVGELPYRLERIRGSSSVLIADVGWGDENPPCDLFHPEVGILGSGAQSIYSHSVSRTRLKQFRVQGLGPEPVDLRVRYCPEIPTEEDENAQATVLTEEQRQVLEQYPRLLVGSWNAQNSTTTYTYSADGAGVFAYDNGVRLTIKWSVIGDKLSVDQGSGSVTYKIVNLSKAAYTIREDDGRVWNALRKEP